MRDVPEVAIGLAVLGLASCSGLLGLTAPKAQIDAPSSDAGSDAGIGDFTIQVTTAAPRVPQNGFDFLAVTVTRDELAAPIVVDIPSPPPGVMVTPVTIDGSATSGTLQLAGGAELVVGNVLTLELVATGGPARHTVDFDAAVTLQPGILDPGFANAGVFVPSLGSAEKFGDCSDVSIAPSAAVTVASEVDSQSNVQAAAVFRLTAAGQLDPTFAVGPIIGSNDGFNAIARQSSGDVVVAGINADPGNGLTFAAWSTSYDPNGGVPVFFGSADNDFVDSTQGYSIGEANAVSVAALPDDQLLLALDNLAGTETGFLVRQTAAGTNQGNTVFAVPLAFEPASSPAAMALDTGSGFTAYLGGSQILAGAEVGVVAHVLADGSFDAGFGSSGVVVLATGTSVTAVAVQGDGDVLAGGVAVGSANSAAFLERLQPDGVLDPGFGSAGVVELTGLVGSGAVDEITAVAPQADRRIVLAVQTQIGSQQVWRLLRLLPDGSLDPSYGSGGAVSLDVFVVISSVRLAPDGDAVVCATLADSPIIAVGRVTF
jgi:uncharacterized delta-60 repeat protein